MKSISVRRPKPTGNHRAWFHEICIQCGASLVSAILTEDTGAGPEARGEYACGAWAIAWGGGEAVRGPCYVKLCARSLRDTVKMRSAGGQGR